MRQTLFLIPHEVAGLPIFGFGWLLIALAVALVMRIVWARKQSQSPGEVLAGEGLMWGIAAVAIAFVLPAVELKNVAGEPVGMAIRGYGVMLLTGVLSAVGLSAVRAKNRGIDPDVIFSLAPWVFVGGIAGARLFYVIQYRENFVSDSLFQTLRNIVAFTEGGLVVYGSIIGGFIASLIFIARHRLPVLKLGDAIVPCIFLGIFFGRIGCLMNGCCYGGRCEEGWASVRFPPGSAVYQDQIDSGELLGIKVNPVTSRITRIEPGSLADDVGIKSGQKVDRIMSIPPPEKTAPLDIPAERVRTGVGAVVDGKTYSWPPTQLPKRALPVRAVQVLSSVSSLILCGLLCGLSLLVKRQGAIMMLGLAGYAILRFVLELVRVDEGGQFGTDLSISQWISICVLICAIGGIVWIYLQPCPVSAESAEA